MVAKCLACTFYIKLVSATEKFSFAVCKSKSFKIITQNFDLDLPIRKFHEGTLPCYTCPCYHAAEGGKYQLVVLQISYQCYSYRSWLSKLAITFTVVLHMIKCLLYCMNRMVLLSANIPSKILSQKNRLWCRENKFWACLCPPLQLLSNKEMTLPDWQS